MNDSIKYYAGLDMGSVSIKAVLISDDGLIASSLIPSGGNYKKRRKKSHG